MRFVRSAATIALITGLNAAAVASPIESGAVRVIDGDTIEARGAVWRLVGFDAPETGRRAQCSIEGERGERARTRLLALPNVCELAAG